MATQHIHIGRILAPPGIAPARELGKPANLSIEATTRCASQSSTGRPKNHPKGATLRSKGLCVEQHPELRHAFGAHSDNTRADKIPGTKHKDAAGRKPRSALLGRLRVRAAPSGQLPASATRRTPTTRGWLTNSATMHQVTSRKAYILWTFWPP